jgi:hypothetical protein
MLAPIDDDPSDNENPGRFPLDLSELLEAIGSPRQDAASQQRIGHESGIKLGGNF